jgi:hypothetical protein
VYGYNPLGEKSFEISTDDKEKIIKKSIYTYDKNSMKIEKKTTDGNGNLISVKKYAYEY